MIEEKGKQPHEHARNKEAALDFFFWEGGDVKTLMNVYAAYYSFIRGYKSLRQLLHTSLLQVQSITRFNNNISDLCFVCTQFAAPSLNGN